MKTKTTIKQILLALTIVLSMASCKKDKQADPDPEPATPAQAITITDLKALSTGTSVKVPDAKKITGIVISDVSNKNIDSKTVILQESTDKPGVIITFDAAQTFALGDQVEVVISNQTLAQVNGEITLQNIPVANAKKTGTGTITAKATTAADIETNKTAWDGTLVTLSAGSFSGGNGDGKYAGSLIYTDAQGTVKSNVLAGAAFAGTAYPAAVTTVTGIVRVNGTNVSVDLRNAADVAADVTIVRTITDDFSTYQSVRGGFSTTPLGNWQGTFSYFLPLANDDFLQAEKKYLYLTAHNNGGSRILRTGYEGQLSGLKTISVTFAASKFTGLLDPNNPGINMASVFNPATQKNGIFIYAIDDDGNAFAIGAASYNDIGVFHTVSIKYPSNKEEFLAALLSAGNAQEDAEYGAETLSNSTSIKIAIGDNSTVRDANGGDGWDLTPIVIDNIKLGFDK